MTALYIETVFGITKIYFVTLQQMKVCCPFSNIASGFQARSISKAQCDNNFGTYFYFKWSNEKAQFVLLSGE